MNQSTIQRRKNGLIGYDIEKMAGGYTLFAPQTGNGRVDLINQWGKKVHQWDMPIRPGRDAVLRENGNLCYNGSFEKSPQLYPAWDIWHGGHFIEVNINGDIVWEFVDPYHHHDAVWLDNGNLLYSAAVECDFGISDVIKEVNRDGELVWEWKVWEHIDRNEYKKHECFNDDHWPMVNGLCVTKSGLVLMSLRTTSGIIGVNKKTREIHRTIKYPKVAQQHCPVETIDGTILCFDNGNIRPNSIHHSRIIEFYAHSNEIVWQYVDPMPPAFFSPYMGSVQRLWNGNTFICESAFGRLFEVTTDGETVWEYVIPDFAEYPAPLNNFITGAHNSCFKAHRYKNINWV
jgi:hypothetical protein